MELNYTHLNANPLHPSWYQRHRTLTAMLILFACTVAYGSVVVLTVL